MAGKRPRVVQLEAKIGQRLHMPKMAELIAGNLRRQIARGELSEGDALPSEAALMEQFEVSRPTLREAFRVLESESLITIRRGSQGGARVKPPDGAVAARYAGLVLEYRGTTLGDVFVARSEIESSCAEMAAKSRTDADLARLEEIYDEIDAADDIASRIALHTQFDAAVVEASHNQTMIVLSSMLRSIIDKSTLTSVLQTASRPSTVEAYHAAHRARRRLIDLIRAQDATMAGAHWHHHLDLAKQFVLAHGAVGHSVLDLL